MRAQLGAARLPHARARCMPGDMETSVEDEPSRWRGGQFCTTCSLFRLRNHRCGDTGGGGWRPAAPCKGPLNNWLCARLPSQQASLPSAGELSAIRTITHSVTLAVSHRETQRLLHHARRAQVKQNSVVTVLGIFHTKVEAALAVARHSRFEVPRTCASPSTDEASCCMEMECEQPESEDAWNDPEDDHQNALLAEPPVVGCWGQRPESFADGLRPSDRRSVTGHKGVHKHRNRLQVHRPTPRKKSLGSFESTDVAVAPASSYDDARELPRVRLVMRGVAPSRHLPVLPCAVSPDVSCGHPAVERADDFACIDLTADEVDVVDEKGAVFPASALAQPAVVMPNVLRAVGLGLRVGR